MIRENFDQVVTAVMREASMDAPDAVARFRAAGKREGTALRMVGYAVLIQQGGWELVHRLMDAESAGMLRQGFEDAGIDPGSITFPEGTRPYLEELVRSSAHPAAAELGRHMLAEGER